MLQDWPLHSSPPEEFAEHKEIAPAATVAQDVGQPASTAGAAIGSGEVATAVEMDMLVLETKAALVAEKESHFSAVAELGSVVVNVAVVSFVEYAAEGSISDVA